MPRVMLSPSEADAAIAAHVPAARQTRHPLTGLAGRILRQAVVAERDQPPFDRVSMDGIALSMAAWQRGLRSYRIATTQAAGAPPATLRDDADCIEVMTGAVLPAGCDAVIPVELLDRTGDTVSIQAGVEPHPWQNVHRRGSDGRAGETLLSAGTLLGAPEVAIVASAGLAAVDVAAEPRIMVISTGDELVEPGAPIQGWQIRRSNAYAVVALLERRGYTAVAHDHLPDDLPVLRARLAAHLDAHDTVVLSGGVSMGRFDYVPQVLAELGVTPVFHKIAQRPGKPMWFGVRAPDKTVYALPGNPVSTLVCCVRYVVPGLEAARGGASRPPGRVLLATPVDVPAGNTLFLPVSVAQAADGRPLATPRPTHGSGDFVSLAGTDGFVELPAGPRTAAAGSLVAFHAW